MDVYQKTVKILEIYSESILSLSPVKNNPINIMLQEHLKQNTDENILKRQYKSMLWLSVVGLAGMELPSSERSVWCCVLDWWLKQRW